MHRAAILAPFACVLPAQNHFVPAEHWFVRVDVRDVPGLTAAVEQSALGELLHTEAMQASIADLRRLHAKTTARYEALESYARGQSLLTADELIATAFYGIDLGDLQDFMLAAYYDKASTTPWPGSLAILTPLPRAEGRTAATCQALCRELEHCMDSERHGEQKIGGFPADVFAPRQDDGMDRSLMPEWYGRFALLHLPGEFVYASGDMLKVGGFGPQPPRTGGPAVAMTVRLKNMPSGTEEMQQLGFDPEGVLAMSLRIEGRLLQAEAAADVIPHSLLEALVHGTAALPRQPLPSGGLLQLRLALDPKELLQALKSLQGPFGGLGLADGLGAWLPLFGGGVALAIAEPPPGGIVPRLWLSLSLQDAAAFAAQVQGLPQDEHGLQFESRKLAGHDCTLIRVPDMPAGLQPCYCIVDGTLHAAETTASLTQLLRNLQGDGDAMPVAAPPPAGDGEPLASFDLRFDDAAIYRCYRKLWMQPLRLLLASVPDRFLPADMLEPLTDPDLLPPVELIEQHVAPGRAVMRRRGNHVVYSESSALGGPLLTPLFGTYMLALLLRSGEGSEWRLQALSSRIEKRQLELLATALQKYERDHHEKAPDLAALAAAGLLGEDTLLMPGDDSPESIAFTDREQQARTLKSSFVFLPKGIAVQSYGGQSTLVAVRRQPPAAGADERSQIFGGFNTVFLDADGEVHEEYGDDDFQKAVQRARAAGDKH